MVKDYQNLLQKYQIQEQELVQQFQLSTLEILESLLLQLPTVTAAVNQNPELPALTLLPLLKPIQELLETWGIKAIASVGDKIPYNPSEHELMEGTAKPGDLVEVRYLGYCQGDKLLYRAKVSAN
jgi:molecular chaperone GrpE (heat shock protein)